MKLLTLTQGSDTFSVADKDILKVASDGGSGSLLQIDVIGGIPRTFEVSESPAAIFAESDTLISVTSLATNSTIYLNATKVSYTSQYNDGCAIYMDLGGINEAREEVTDTQADVIAKVNSVTADSAGGEVKLMRLEYDYDTTSKSGTFEDSDVDVSNDTITIEDHGFANSDTVLLTTTGALPTGLSTATAYYVINATENTFQLSATDGGAAVNITAASGGGTHTARTNVFGNVTFGVLGNLPDNAIVKRAYYDVVTTFTSSTDAAELGIGIQTNDVNGIVASTAISAGGNIWDAGYHDGIQDGAAANFAVKTTDIRKVELSVATESITAGKMVIFLEYVISE